MQTPAQEAYDVAIVGYGPTGLALASWLGRAGHSVIVIERWPTLYKLPRAGHIDGEVMRLFQKLGVGETIAAESAVTGDTCVRGADGQYLATLPQETCDQGWEAHYSLYQPRLETALDGMARSTGKVTVLQGWRAQSIDEDADGVTVRIVPGLDPDGNQVAAAHERTVRARWLVGADGANSLVAQHLGGDVEDLGYRARALVIFARHKDLGMGQDMPDLEVGMVLPRPYIALRQSGKLFSRWEFHVHNDEDMDQMSTPDKAWELIGRWGFTPDNSELVRHSVFEFRTLINHEWHRGRTILAGDSAHRMPPFQGQGMCSGQRDAAALAWRLDLILRGISSVELLGSYTGERRPHVRSLTSNAADRGRTFWETDPEIAHRRDEAMAEKLANENLGRGYGAVPTLTAGALVLRNGEPVAPAGQLSPQFNVLHSGQRKLLDDVVGPDWLLVVSSNQVLDTVPPEHRELLSRIGVRVWVLDSASPDQNEDDPVLADLSDIDGGYAEWLSSTACSAVLVRPDSYIFGGAKTVSDIGTLVDSLAAHLQLAKAALT